MSGRFDIGIVPTFLEPRVNHPNRNLLFFLCVTLMATLARADDDLPRRGFMGVQLAPPAEQQPGGVKVAGVLDGGSAKDAGVAAGDVITAVNGVSVNGPPQFMAEVSKHKAGAEVKLSLKRDGKSLELALKIKPLPRESSDAYDVLYGVVDAAGAKLRTITTRPRDKATKFPAVLIVQGLSCSSVESALPNMGGYRRFVEHWTTNGFVTMRIEKSGIGDSGGAPCAEIDFETEGAGYKAALSALKKLDFVDAERVFIFGHSMGGVYAPLIAAENPVRGIMVYGTCLRNWIEYMLENDRRQSLQAGMSHAEVDDLARNGAAFIVELFLYDRAKQDILKEHPALGPAAAYYFEGSDDNHMYGRHLGFFRQLAKTNLAAAWQKVNANVLAIWGEHDWVTSPYDHDLIAEIVNKNRAASAKSIVMPKMDHGFTTHETHADSIKTPFQGPFDPAILEETTRWMREVLAK